MRNPMLLSLGLLPFALAACSDDSSSPSPQDASPSDSGSLDAPYDADAQGEDSPYDAPSDSPSDSAPDTNPNLCSGGALLQGSYRDLGELPEVSRALSVVVLGSDVLVGTVNGIYRRPFDGSGSWTPSGLAGYQVQALAIDPLIPNRLYAGIEAPVGQELHIPPFQISDNGGQSFTAHGEAFEVYQEDAGANKIYGSIQDIAITPQGSGRMIFASGMADALAESLDQGEHFEFLRGLPDAFGYPCVIETLEDSSLSLYQGCELPLDRAWIDRFDVNQNGELTARERILDSDVLSNRRPNVLISNPHAPGKVYAGLEGAMMELWSDGSFITIYRVEQGSTPPPVFPYSFIQTVWVDPCSPTHLVFGGYALGDNSQFQLYETFSGRPGVHLLPKPDFLSGPWFQIEEGALAGAQDEHLVLLVSETADDGITVLRSRVLVWEHPHG